uniref:ENTH domain-containing protein n=1 Tax=Denticeps clupeoides TaxID=299321 RepID=A0AAY4CDF4_9TELE
MTTSALRRQVKNIVHNYSEAEIKVREATSNDPWGPSSSLMSEIADLTFSVVAFSEVMSMVWKRLNDHGKNWRHVYKALTLLDYLAKTGSERVAQQCRENAFTIQTLRDFQYVDRDGRDQGVNVREKAKQLVALLRDEDRLRQERAQALKTKERMAGGGGGSGGGGTSAVPPAHPGRRTSQPSMAALYGEEFSRSRGSPSSFNSSSSSPRASDLEQTRPQTSGEEELQLQLALAMSREESQREHRSRQGDESLLQKSLQNSRRDTDPGTGESAMIDLVDIFGPASGEPPGDDPWDAQPTCPVNSDPWESAAAVNNCTPEIGSPWMSRPVSSSPAQPWGNSQSPTDPWEAPPVNPSSSPGDQTWRSPANKGAAGTHPFSLQEPEGKNGDDGLPDLFSPRSESPAAVYSFIHFSVYSSICPPICLSMHPFFCLFNCLSVCLSTHLSIHESILVYSTVCLSVCLSTHLSFHASTLLSIQLSVCLSVHPSVYPCIHSSVYSTVCLSTHLSIHESILVYSTVCLSVCLSTHLSFHASTLLSIQLSVCLSVCPPICLSMHPFFCLFNCLSVC